MKSNQIGQPFDAIRDIIHAHGVVRERLTIPILNLTDVTFEARFVFPRTMSAAEQETARTAIVDALVGLAVVTRDEARPNRAAPHLPHIHYIEFQLASIVDDRNAFDYDARDHD